MNIHSISAAGACLIMALSGCNPSSNSSTSSSTEPIRAWDTVVNSYDLMPNVCDGCESRTFSSFNQPSVSANGIVVFRARGRGEPPTRGIYVRDMADHHSLIQTITGSTSVVSEPNNIMDESSDQLTSFIEFPSIPRISINSDAVATRGNHPPVWEYILPDDSETRAGTTGIYVQFDATDPNGQVLTGASKLGAIDEFPFYRVPELDPATAFEVFPGSPAITDDFVIAFKGNFPDEKTGVFYRLLEDVPFGGEANWNFVQTIASSNSEIPNPGACEVGTLFGSTAPPSAAVDASGYNRVVFVGFDNEDDPTCGGIYMAAVEAASAPLTTLVGLEADVPGEALGTTFNRLGEGLSFDGRYVGFWGAWGEDTRTVRFYCPTEGSMARRAYCNGDDPLSICVEGEPCYQDKTIPIHQGFFVHDTWLGETQRIAVTGDEEGGFDDFLYWVYSGRVPGVGGEESDEAEVDGHFARWRASAFIAVTEYQSELLTAFKAHQNEATSLESIDAIYVTRVDGDIEMKVLVDTTMSGTLLDVDAPEGSVVSALGIERDGFRSPWLVINASIEADDEEEDGVSGIYVYRLP